MQQLNRSANKINKMKQKILLLAICFCFPSFALAQVYKCKNVEGLTSFSDRPCPNTATTLVAPAKSNSPPPSPTLNKPKLVQSVPSEMRGKQLQEEKEAKNKSSAETQKPYFERRAPDNPTPLSERDRQIMTEANKRAADYVVERDKGCAAGNEESCAQKSCFEIADGKAQVSDFVRCYKSRGYPMGKFWAITYGKPDTRALFEEEVKYFMSARAKLGKQTSEKLSLVCFRHQVGSEVRTDEYALEESLYVNKDANGLHYKRVYSLRNLRTDLTIPPVMQEYPSIDALAEAKCER